MIITNDKFRISLLDINPAINHEQSSTYDPEFILTKRVKYISPPNGNFKIVFNKHDARSYNIFTAEQIKKSYKVAMSKFIKCVYNDCQKIITGENKENYLYNGSILEGVRNTVMANINSHSVISLDAIFSDVFAIQSKFDEIIRAGS